jgi:excinuclease ABC subunit A
MTAGDIPVPGTLPTVIGVRGARHNNLQDIDVDVPLWRTVAVVGVSGSGKTSLAIGTLYAEGMHRFLEGLSTYSRRRLAQAQRPELDRIDHLPPALALRQRPPIPGPRSTVGTMSEVLNVLRLMVSRLGSHLCPNGHHVAPSIATQNMEIVCPECGARFDHPSAESFAFNSYGACPACEGLGVRPEVNVAALVPDLDKTIEDGAVLPWNAGGRRLYQYAARELGVRLNVPWRSLTDRERDIVLDGEPVQRRVRFQSGRQRRTVELNVTYENAVATARRALNGDSEQARRQVRCFFDIRTCSVCHGTRLRPEALTSLLGGRNIAEISALRLDELREFTASLPAGIAAELERMTTGLLAELTGTLTPLLEVGLGYLTLDRSGASLSTGERQRIELTSTVRASTTGMLYVLDEPSVGLHPSNVRGLRATIAALAGNGNSVVVVEHERDIILGADWVIEMGPAAGTKGGTIVAEGTPSQLEADPRSIIGPFLAGTATVSRDRLPDASRSPDGTISVEVGDLYNLHDVTAEFPERRLTVLAGPSGAGKTALVLDSLIPAARAQLNGSALPGHVRRLDLGGIRQVVQVDASPIGQNARSTPATYSGAFDQIRRVFAETPYARRRRWKPGHFSFNTREGQCPTCRGLGGIDLDVQYLPDITVQCPTCHGARFNDDTLAVRVDGMTIAGVLGLTVAEALDRFAGWAPVVAALRPVNDVGLGYLRLGEPTPSLSGGESQRLRIATRLRSSQRGALYVFDEPSTGLHPLDVATLVRVFDRLLEAGATIIVIDHDLDLLTTADHLIDMGPGAGPDGGRIVAAGRPADVARDPDSPTGPWLAEHLGQSSIGLRRGDLRGHLVQLLDLRGAERERRRGGQRPQLPYGARARDRRGHGGLGQQPRQRDRRQFGAVVGRDGVHGVDDRQARLAEVLSRQLLPRGTLQVRGGAVLPGQEPAGEREVRHDADLELLGDRRERALVGLPEDEVVVRLEGHRQRPAVRLRDRDPLPDSRGGVVGDGDVPDLARLLQRAERPDGLLQRGVLVVAVCVVQVDVVRLQPRERGVRRRGHVLRRESPELRVLAHLGPDHDRRAVAAGLHPFPDDRLGLAAGVARSEG